eukprot:1650662-Ditylum_brightwellii.AAC.1
MVETRHNKAVTMTCSVATTKNTQQSTSSGVVKKATEEGFDGHDGDGDGLDGDGNDHDSGSDDHDGDGHGSDGSHFTPCS